MCRQRTLTEPISASANALCPRLPTTSRSASFAALSSTWAGMPSVTTWCTVTAAELLSAAAFSEGKHAQAFPSFGSERSGAPVMSFCRIDDRPIRSREPVTTPDVLVIQDPTLLHQVSVFEGAEASCRVLINSARPIGDLNIGEFTSKLPPGAVVTVPATELALQYLGKSVPSAALLGGFAALTGLVTLDSVLAAVAARFAARPEIAAGNAQAAWAAFRYVADTLAELSIGRPASAQNGGRAAVQANAG